MGIMRVAYAGLAIEAAAKGFGRASVPLLLAEKDIAEGRVRQTGERRKSSRANWLIASLPQWRQKKVKALVEELTADRQSTRLNSRHQCAASMPASASKKQTSIQYHIHHNDKKQK